MRGAAREARVAAADGTPRVMFLCTGNSCRSQMAEGWARHLHGGAIEACSAGTRPLGLNRLAVVAMTEAGVDISGQSSKAIEACEPATLDLVITVCGRADETCPVFPGATRVVHRGFDDPPRLVEGAATDAEALPHYRRVRDEIRNFVATLPMLLATGTGAGKAEGSRR